MNYVIISLIDVIMYYPKNNLSLLEEYKKRPNNP